MSVRFVSGSVGFLVLVAAPMASAACYRDTECPGSQVCLNLECQEPATPLNKCGEDTTDGGSDGASTDGSAADDGSDGGTTGGAIPPAPCAGGRVCVDDYCKEHDVHCGNEFGECYVGVSSYSCSCDGGGSDGGGTGGDVGSDALPAPTDEALYATCLAEVAFCEAATDGADGGTTDGVDVGSDATDGSTTDGSDVGSDVTDGSTDSGGDVGSEGSTDSATDSMDGGVDGGSDGSTGAADATGDDGGGDAADAATGGDADGGGTGDDASADGAGDDGPSGDTAGDAADGTTGTPSSSTASSGCTLGGAAASPACLLILGAFGLLRRRRSV